MRSVHLEKREAFLSCMTFARFFYLMAFFAFCAGCAPRINQPAVITSDVQAIDLQVDGAPSNAVVAAPDASNRGAATTSNEIASSLQGDGFELSPGNVEDGFEMCLNARDHRFASLYDDQGGGSIFESGEDQWRRHVISSRGGQKDFAGSSLYRPISLSFELNPAIEKCINYYLKHNRRGLEAGLKRSTLYRSMIEQKLLERGLPQQLKWIPFVESRYQSGSISAGQYAGMWQLATGTARQFGLRIGGGIDERKDPELSTDAALDTLEYLYNKLHSWLLALAAYNAGEGRILEAMKIANTHDYWKLSQDLPVTTQFYVSAILALDHIAENSSRYGIEMD
jgi:hypothetical protein